jgi:hypothetical protein
LKERTRLHAAACFRLIEDFGFPVLTPILFGSEQARREQQILGPPEYPDDAYNTLIQLYAALLTRTPKQLEAVRTCAHMLAAHVLSPEQLQELDLDEAHELKIAAQGGMRPVTKN